MGRLSGFRYTQVARKLKLLGFAYQRQASGSHEIWADASGRVVVVPHHAKPVPEGTLRAILRVAAIDVDDFLNA